MGFAQQLLNHVPHLAHATQLHAEEASQGAASGESGESEVHQAGDFSSTARGAEELRRLEGALVRVDLLNNNNSQPLGPLGSPKQRFTAVFDTGSGITWVPGADCKSDTCSEHHRFGVDGSKSFQEFAPGARADGTIHYGTGQVEYVDGRDTLTFCDSHSDPGCHGMKAKQLKVESQPFGMSTNQTDYPFRILPFDGILGLAPSASSGSVMHALKKSNALDRNLFGVYLSEDTHRSGSISFGGIENAHIAPKSPLTWHQIQNDQEWTLAMKDILVDGKPLHICDDRPDGVCPAVVDTGSSLITGPSGEVEKLLSKVRLKEDCSNLGKLPNVSLRIADRNGVLTDYPLTPEEYTLKSLDEVPQTGNSEYLKEFPVLGGSGDQVPEVKPRCDPGMGVMDVPGRKWVIGDTFLRRYYSIYDDDRGLVGFAKSIHPDEAVAKDPVSPDAAAAPDTRMQKDTQAAMLFPWAAPCWRVKGKKRSTSCRSFL
ncbi:Pepsin II-2/3 (Pepsin A) [Durusdinium trenchii]|uniref:Pepsin II-2/3 (Pepsin A) n=1 Tax=Durusdinium trenchii TaxID=1381693 RepID=A0ABP0HZ38_9DINO